MTNATEEILTDVWVEPVEEFEHKSASCSACYSTYLNCIGLWGTSLCGELREITRLGDTVDNSMCPRCVEIWKRGDYFNCAFCGKLTQW